MQYILRNVLFIRLKISRIKSKRSVHWFNKLKLYLVNKPYPSHGVSRWYWGAFVNIVLLARIALKLISFLFKFKIISLKNSFRKKRFPRTEDLGGYWSEDILKILFMLYWIGFSSTKAINLIIYAKRFLNFNFNVHH